MRSITTLQDVDSGSIGFNNIDVNKNPKELKKVLGYLPQSFGVYPKMSAEKFVSHIALLKGIVNKGERKDCVNYLLNKVNLYDKKHLAIDSFSGGMKQRVGIAQALIGDPKLIIVDEPTAGLDPSERHKLHNIFSEISENSILILSTHILEDIENLCSKLAIMNEGKIVFNNTIENGILDIENKVYTKEIEIEELDNFKNSHNVISSKHIGDHKLKITVFSEDNIPGFEYKSPTLEDVYFNKTFKK